MTLNEKVLAADKCDFEEESWNAGKDSLIPLTNWGDLSVLIKKQSNIGKTDQAELVTQDDPHWRAELQASSEYVSWAVMRERYCSKSN